MSLIQFSQNIADAEAPAPLPAGEYEGVCVSAVPGISKSSGNPMLPLGYKVTADQFPADFDAGGVDELSFTYNRLTTRDTAQDRFRMKNICLAHGVAMSNNIDANDFIGKRVKLVIGIEKDLEGNDRAAITKILPL